MTDAEKIKEKKQLEAASGGLYPVRWDSFNYEFFIPLRNDPSGDENMHSGIYVYNDRGDVLQAVICGHNRHKYLLRSLNLMDNLVEGDREFTFSFPAARLGDVDRIVHLKRKRRTSPAQLANLKPYRKAGKTEGKGKEEKQRIVNRFRNMATFTQTRRSFTKR